MKRTPKVHYLAREGDLLTACGRRPTAGEVEATPDAARVTCGRCQEDVPTHLRAASEAVAERQPAQRGAAGNMAPDLTLMAARRKLGVGDEYKMVTMRWLECGDTLLELGVPGTFKRGPRKGRDNWKGVPRKPVVVTKAERQAEADRYEHETGNCHVCGGKGQEWVGWNHLTGHKYEECSACGGSGKPAQWGAA